MTAARGSGQPNIRQGERVCLAGGHRMEPSPQQACENGGVPSNASRPPGSEMQGNPCNPWPLQPSPPSLHC